MDDKDQAALATLEKRLNDTVERLHEKFSEQMEYGDFHSLDPGTRHEIEEEVEEAIERWQESQFDAYMTGRKMIDREPIQALLKEYCEVEEAILDIRDDDLGEDDDPPP